MQGLLSKISKLYFSMNKLSKYYIKFGSIIVFSLYLSALFCFIFAGKIGNYDYLMFTCNELLVCGKEMIGAVYVPALLVEIIVIAEKMQFQYNQ